MQRLWYHLQYIPAHSRLFTSSCIIWGGWNKWCKRSLWCSSHFLIKAEWNRVYTQSLAKILHIWATAVGSDRFLADLYEWPLLCLSLSFCLGIFTGSLWHLCNTQRFIQHSFRMDGLMQAVIKLLQTQSTNFFFSLLSLSACGWLLYPVDGVASCPSQHRESHYFKHLIMLLQQSSSSYTRIAAISQP